MVKDAGELVQGMPLGRGNTTGLYNIKDTDTVVEFAAAGDVTTVLEDSSTPTVTSVKAGSRYAIPTNIVSISFAGVYNIG